MIAAWSGPGHDSWSVRIQHKVLRVARTIADLAGESRVGVTSMAEVIRLQAAVNAGH